MQTERVTLGEIVGRERHVARVVAGRRPGPPQEIPADAPLVRHEVDPEVGAEAPELDRRLDPTRRGDQEVALGRRGQLLGVPIAIRRRTSFCGNRRHVPSSRDGEPSMKVAELPTPALVVDTQAFMHNLDVMTAALPGPRLRPHVKAHKCTSLAREQAARGHRGFTCATPGEIVGMAEAGLGDDLLLANQCVDATRLRAMAECGARVTVAVDSEPTIDAAAACGHTRSVGRRERRDAALRLSPGAAGEIAAAARAAGLDVRGVMGYEGHAVGLEDRAQRAALTAESMELLAAAHASVGGDVISAGGTGTYDLNELATEIQAGSYALMDGAYAKLVGSPFVPALSLVATVIHAEARYAVADCGLKAQSMDHGNPTIDGATVWFCSDEHITFDPEQPVPVGGRVVVWPAHVDPTVAVHQRMHLADGPGLDASVIDTWSVDLRGWDVAAVTSAP